MQTRTDREIDEDVLGLDSGLFTSLPKVGRATLPSSCPRDVDYDVMSLHTNVFDSLPPVATVSLVPPPVETARSAYPTRTIVEILAASLAAGVLLGAGLYKLTAAPRAVAEAVAPAAQLEARAAPAIGAPAAPLPVVATTVPVEEAPPALVAAPLPKPDPVRMAARVAPPAEAQPIAAPPADLPASDASALAAAVARAVEPRAMDERAAATAIAVAAKRAAACVTEDETRTTMPVRVTFAPSGRVTQAVIRGGAFVGSDVGSCIARTLRGATVGAFDGPAVTVSTTIRVR